MMAESLKSFEYVIKLSMHLMMLFVDDNLHMGKINRNH